MTSLYEILKASKGVPVDDMYTALFGRAVGGASEIEYTGSVPVSIKADGSPIIAYRISGNLVQTGTPTPESPIQPEETGERTGNLLNLQELADGYPNDVSFDGTILDVVNGSTYLYNRGINVDFPSGCYFSCVPLEKENAATNARVRFIYTDDTAKEIYITKSDGTPSAGIGTLDKPVKSLRLNWSSFNNGFKLQFAMLNSGTEPLPYEPHGYKLPVISGGVTTPIYLGEVETTRKIGKIDLGTLNWGKTASGNFWAATAIPNIRTIGNSSTGNAICDIFKEVTPNAVANEPYSFSSCLNTVGRPFINSTGFEDITAEEFKEAMSGVYMYYVLATETTGIINEPLRKIGDYADTVSMEQAQVTIPTSNGSQTFDVNTTLKPSEVYIKYKGKA